MSTDNGGAPDSTNRTDGAPQVRVAIVGTGFSGLGMAIRLKRAGIEDFVLLERADDVGGTWRDNTYPGCQCDVPSHLYSYSFALNPNWSRTYSREPELWAYLRKCADRFELIPHIRFGHDVLGAAWDEGARRWRIETSRGQIAAQILIGGNGPLTEPSLPDIPGLERFAGTLFHSARWNHDHDLRGERVAVIGTGASAIQFVPRIQPHAGRLHVFQRTPPWVLPHSDRPVTPLEHRLYRRFPYLQRMVRRGIYWIRESVVPGFVRNRGLLRALALAARLHLRRQVPDKQLRDKLRPDYRIGCKRILPSSQWYRALTRDNVEVVTDGIREIRPHSIVTADGAEREIDTLILGTGFHVTDVPHAADLRGREGRTLAEVWDGSPQSYLGAAVPGFPNLFTLLGPNTGLAHTSVVIMIEAQIAYVIDCLRAMDAQGLESVEVRPEVHAAYNDEIQTRMKGTVWTAGGCQSWYIDRNGLNTTIWPAFTWQFRQRASSFDPDDYVVLAKEATSSPSPEPVGVARPV
jgi:cation diffusion facilitator CzcD-associated flavoprotein CzcO